MLSMLKKIVMCSYVTVCTPAYVVLSPGDMGSQQQRPILNTTKIVSSFACHHEFMFIILGYLSSFQVIYYQALRRIPSLMNPAPVTESRLSASTFPVTIASSKSLVRFSFSRVSLVFGRLWRSEPERAAAVFFCCCSCLVRVMTRMTATMARRARGLMEGMVGNESEMNKRECSNVASIILSSNLNKAGGAKKGSYC